MSISQSRLDVRRFRQGVICNDVDSYKWPGPANSLAIIIARSSHLIAGALRAGNEPPPPLLGRDGLVTVTITCSSHLFSTNQMLLASVGHVCVGLVMYWGCPETYQHRWQLTVTFNHPLVCHAGEDDHGLHYQWCSILTYRTLDTICGCAVGLTVSTWDS